LISSGVGRSPRASRCFVTRREFVADDLVAQVDALVADEDRRARDQLLDLVLALPAERAIKRFLAGRAFFVGHGQVPRYE
jgi:hypothetical protein